MHRYSIGTASLVAAGFIVAFGLFAPRSEDARASDGSLARKPSRLANETKSSKGRPVENSRLESAAGLKERVAKVTAGPSDQGTVAGPGPINDACGNAIPVTDGITPLDNRGATTDGPAEPSCGFEFGDPTINFDIWFDYTASCTGELSIRLCGTPPTTQGGFDTKIAVYAGGDCPPSSAPLACNDDGCPAPSPLASRVQFRTSLGAIYKLRVGGFFQNGTGTGSMSITCTPDFPACVGATGDCCAAHGSAGCSTTSCCETVCNIQSSCCNENWDEFCAATAMEVCPACGGGNGENCPGCIVVQSNVPYAGSTVGATGNDKSSCAGPNDTADVWHCWRADCTGTATIRLCDVDFDTTLAVFDACGGTEVACDDDSGCTTLETAGSQVRFAAVADAVYRVRVAGFGGATGNYTLSARCDAGPTNDTCGNALPIANGKTDFSTLEATSEGPALDPVCDEGFGVLLGQDIWYDYVAECSGVATFSVCNDADFDTRMAVYYDCDCPVDNGRLTGCNDDAPGCDLTSELSVPVSEGSCYKLRVGGFQDFTGSDAGVGSITVSCQPPSPNDFCEDASIQTLPAVFTGNNSVATDDCPQLFTGRQVWVAFRLTEPSDVTLSYCGSTPVFFDAWLNLTRNCPCEGSTDDAAGCKFCEDGNPMMTWFCLPAGVYYYPVFSERGSTGNYRIEVTATSCRNHNACANALPIDDGTTVFSNIGASTDGPTSPASCNEGSASFNSDVWFDYVATCNGTATVGTCNTANFDTRLAMYSGTECPTTNDRLIGCDDNTTGCAGGTSHMEAPVARGLSYKIRVGSRGLPTGVGCVSVGCVLNCPAGELSFEFPERNTVDARAPRDPNDAGTALRGIDRVTVHAPAGVEPECFELCEPNSEPLGPNGIAEVTEDAPGEYRIHFHRPITPNAATVLRYLGDPLSRPELIYHPGNVNADDAATADDVVSLVAYFFDNQAGALKWGDFSGDIDGDGERTLLDIAALVNVLNGAGSLDPALGTMKPAAAEGCR